MMSRPGAMGCGWARAQLGNGSQGMSPSPVAFFDSAASIFLAHAHASW